MDGATSTTYHANDPLYATRDEYNNVEKIHVNNTRLSSDSGVDLGAVGSRYVVTVASGVLVSGVGLVR